MPTLSSGYVLCGARAASNNSSSTAAPSQGVSRSVVAPPAGAYPATSATRVAARVEMYRATVAEGAWPGVEYLVWAATGGPWETTAGRADEARLTIPRGTRTVLDTNAVGGTRADGTDYVFVEDEGGLRRVETVTALAYTRGDGGSTVTWTAGAGHFTWDAATATVRLAEVTAVRAAVAVASDAPVAVSGARGDTLTVTEYTWSAAAFWWTRNDSQRTRFTEDGTGWRLKPGGTPIQLGVLEKSTEFRLNPLGPWAVGTYVPGSALGDEWAAVRVGATPNASSYPVAVRPSGPYTGLRIVDEVAATPTYNWASTTPPAAGVVGVESGTVIWNPAFSSAYAGQTVWYAPPFFLDDATGDLGPLTANEWYLSPVPQPNETPHLRIGTRAPLTVLSFDTETELLGATVLPGQAAVAYSTGRVRLSADEVARARSPRPDLSNENFDPLYWSARLRYEGVTLNDRPQPLRPSSALVDEAGTPVVAYASGGALFVPDAQELPGLGRAGIVAVFDGTGAPLSNGTPTARAGSTGLIRALDSGIGESYLSGNGVRTLRLVAVEREADLPADPYALPADTAYVALERNVAASGSRVILSSGLMAEMENAAIHFTQTEFSPARYARGGRILSRHAEPYTLRGTETLTLRAGSVDVTWSAATLGAGQFTATAVAAAVAAAATTASAPRTARARGGYLELAAVPSTGTLSVGWARDGAAALGLVPGWRVVGSVTTGSSTDPNWLLDTGIALGVYRSEHNLDGRRAAPDLVATRTHRDQVEAAPLAAQPILLRTRIPRDDRPGYDRGVFYAIRNERVLEHRFLRAWRDYYPQAERLGWLESFSRSSALTQPHHTVELGVAGVVAETLAQGVGGRVAVAAAGGPWVELTPDEDVLLDMSAGTLEWVQRFGRLLLRGGAGHYSSASSTFTDSTVVFNTVVAAGDRLEVVSGAGAGWYRILSAGTTSLTVAPSFTAGDGGFSTTWNIYRGAAPNTIDATVIADVTYVPFSPVSNEPFQVWRLDRLGAVGETWAAVAAERASAGVLRRVRFGAQGVEIPCVELTGRDLGAIESTELRAPTADAAWSWGAWALRVNQQVYTLGVNLIGVTSFSTDPGTTIEYLTAGTPGALKVGSAVRATHAGATVRYEQHLPTESAAPPGVAWLDPNTGILRCATATLAANANTVAYLATRGRVGVDVVVNPIAGSFTWTDPMRPGQMVEAQYWRAVPDTGARYVVNGAPVFRRELLPVYRRREVATRVNDRIYQFNPSQKTTVAHAEATVYAGTRQLTYGTPTGVTIDWTTNVLTTTAPWDAATPITITYAVLEAEGGETTYSVAQPPVWRPPFYLAAGQTTFTVEEDRRAELSVGRLLLLGGAWATYIRAVSYASGTNLTTVTIFPAPDSPRGSLAPGEELGALLTDRPVTPTVDPASTAPVTVAAADAGFLATFASAYGIVGVPRFKPLVRGATTLQLEGDFTRYAVAGHLLEMNGVPYLLRGSELSDDGRTTTLQLAAPVTRAWTWSSSWTAARMRISIRPLYPAGARTLVGAPFVSSQPFAVVRWSGTTAPGYTLVEGRDYSTDATTGRLHLLETVAALSAGETMVVHRTERRVLSPLRVGDQTLYPRVEVRGGAITTPSAANGLLGAALYGTYTYDAPDQFYVRALSLGAWAAERAASESTTAAQRAQRGIVGAGGALAEARVADRLARATLEAYHNQVCAWEQTAETFRGEAIGERDGRLQFSVRRDLWNGAAGSEDPITGAVVPRYLWASVWAAARAGLPALTWTSKDPLIHPRTATDDGTGTPTGTTLDAATLEALLEEQKKYVLSDLEDIAITGVERVERQITGLFTFTRRAWASYGALGAGGALSRLFPERTRAFTTLAPGVGASATEPGAYTAGRLAVDLTGDAAPITFQSTRNTAIGRLENPVLGPLTNVTGVVLRPRRARARVLGWFPTGWSAADATTANRPTVWVSVVSRAEFPLTSSGLPNFSRLASQSVTPTPTGVWDCATGHVPLHTPRWTAGMQLAVGTPQGQVYAVGWTGATLGGVYAGVYVDAVIRGCLITLKSQDASGAWIPLTDASTLLRLTGPTQGVPLTLNAGDTLLAIPATGGALTVSDPPTAAELAQITAAVSPPYRAGEDFNWIGASGTLLDATLPSFDDPTLFGFKEITGQNPPSPLSAVEAEVSFQNVRVEPVEVPALRGQYTLDSGDYSAPYFQFRGELELLSNAQETLVTLTEEDSPAPPPTTPGTVSEPYYQEALYPDEVVDDAGSVSADDPVVAGSLYTVQSLSAGLVSYPTPGHAGVGYVRPYDLFLVEPASGGAGMPAGFAGIHTVGAVTFDVSSARVEPPRFVSAVTVGTAFTWSGDNLQVSIAHPSYGVGVVVTTDDSVPSAVVSTFDLSSVGASALVLDDGAGGGNQSPPVGGWNEVLSKCAAGTTFRFDIIQKTTGTTPTTSSVRIRVVTPGANILTTSFEVSGDGGATYTTVNAGGLSFFPTAFTVVSASPFFNIAPFNPITLSANVKQTGGYHDFRISATVIRSTVVSIADDRLTFSAPLDLRSARPRGTRHPYGPAAELLETRLDTGALDYRVVDSATGLNVLVTSPLHDITRINGAVPFTFEARAWSTPSTYDVGTFSGGRGALRVMATEGIGNRAWTGTGIRWAALPTSRQNAAGPLFNGIALTDVVSNLTYNPPMDGRFVFTDLNTVTPVYAGALERVEPGDLVVIRSARDVGGTFPRATGKAGTYLVRAAVPWDDATRPLERRATYRCVAGDESGFVRVRFPAITATGTGTLTVEVDAAMPAALDLNGVAVTASYAFPATGRVWVLVNEESLDSTQSATYAAAIYSAAYSAYNGTTGVFSGLSDYRDGLYNTISTGTWNGAVRAGLRVSGMTRVRLEAPRATAAPLPGYTNLASPGTLAVFGVRSFAATRNATTVTYAANTLGTMTGGSPGTLVVYQHVPQLATTYLAPSTPIYYECAAFLDWSGFHWDGIHTTGLFVPAGARCILPGDSLTVQYSAAAGIFVELSFPRTGGDYGSESVRVVDRDRSLLATEIGPRRLSSYVTLTPSVGQAFYEYAQLEVRRARRWSRATLQLSEPLAALRYVNEIRRGIVSSVVQTGQSCILTANAVSSTRIPIVQVGGAATQLGAFTDSRVGIHYGATVIFGDPAAPVARTSVVAVTGAFTLKIEPLEVTLATNTPFQIWLHRAPVPQEQSAEEICLQLTEREILRRTPNYTTGTGGRVAWVANADAQVAYDSSVNRLRDGDLTVNYVSAQVRAGDLVVVDPAGALAGATGAAAPLERGAAPHGDRSLSTRSGAYVAGGPLHGDDNRGVYRVETVTSSELRVGAVAGVMAGTRTLGDRVVSNGTSAWTWLPTVHGSWLSGAGTGREGQNDLRPTALAAAGSNSFSASWRSVEPFGYRIVRPRSDVDARTLEAAFLFRERILTWMEVLRPWVEESVASTYERFQALAQVNTLGTPEDPFSSAGIVHNDALERVAGVWPVTPYANGSWGTGVDLLGRRVMGGDTRLDRITPARPVTSTPYTSFATGAGRPTWIDWVETLVGSVERWRAKRWAWLMYRTHRATGSWRGVERATLTYDQEAERRIRAFLARED